MEILWILLGVAAFLAAAVLLISYICFRMAFYMKDEDKIPKEEFPIPDGEIYEPYRERMTQWMKETRSLPQEEFWITSYDGLKLRGRYFEFAPGAPIELMMHGYRGNAERDLCGGVQRGFALGRSALIVDQRACGYSQGNVITFGVKERRDCRSWVDFMVGHFGEDVKIHLTGISMGAATVLMAAGYPLPKQVVGVLADCGYTSAREIIEKVIRVDLKLPVKLAYPFVKLAARLYGGFDLEELPPIEAVKNCTVPVIFYHGEADGFVPCDMSVRNFEACRAPRKKLVTIPGADHGLAYPVDKQLYLQTLRDFFEE